MVSDVTVDADLNEVTVDVNRKKTGLSKSQVTNGEMVQRRNPYIER